MRDPSEIIGHGMVEIVSAPAVIRFVTPEWRDGAWPIADFTRECRGLFSPPATDASLGVPAVSSEMLRRCRCDCGFESRMLPRGTPGKLEVVRVGGT